MKQAVKIKEDVYWIGVNDRRTRLFENYWPLPRGVAYNSYLIVDEKVVVVDTIERNKMEDYIESIEAVLNGRTVDHVIVNHMEPDHTGALRSLLGRYPGATVIGNVKTFPMLKNFYDISDRLLEVKEGSTLDTGRHKLSFYMTPMLHWPETMVTFDATTGILFSGDIFGAFGTLDGGIFDDELDLDYLEEEISRYYSNIVGKFGQPARLALDKLGKLPVRVICSTHGPVRRSTVSEIIARYDAWSKHETAKGVVIAFSSMYGNTERMADGIARCLAENGIRKIRVHDTSKTHPSYMINDIFRFRGVILGSCAYNTGIFPTMETLLGELEQIGVKNHLLGYFGNKSWSGGAIRRLEQFAGNVKWEVVHPPHEAWGAPKADDREACREIARAMAAKLHTLYPDEV
ncbi:MAG: FprA family A-type flavoprotein [Odoribacteraceae bacterium]|jgi:flavorubredoxin|nr:FprA family A-type flavoprotein [Odoribacteraceae bacterium]